MEVYLTPRIREKTEQMILLHKISIDNERNFKKLLLKMLVIYFQFLILKWQIHLYKKYIVSKHQSKYWLNID